MSNLLKNLLIALSLAVILFLGYQVFLSDDESTSILSTSNSLEGQAAQETQAFLVRLQSLRDVKIDTAIFDEPAFRSFTDTRKELTDEPTGRSNPFIPVR